MLITIQSLKERRIAIYREGRGEEVEREDAHRRAGFTSLQPPPACLPFPLWHSISLQVLTHFQQNPKRDYSM